MRTILRIQREEDRAGREGCRGRLADCLLDVDRGGTDRSMKGRPPRDIYERFMEKVDRNGPGGCWLWLVSQFPEGYGSFKVDGKTRQSHRVSWVLHRSPIPEGMDVLHSCDNPPCVNPDHLFLGTHVDNMADRDKKGRNVKGEKISHAKLSPLKVQRIRKLVAGGALHNEVAREFRVARTTITKVVNRERWAHVE